jgi:hypothetical protein
MYEENDVTSLAAVLSSLAAPADRRALGAEGRRKMLSGFTWARYAQALEADYVAALTGSRGSRRITA